MSRAKSWSRVAIPEVLFFQEGPGVRKWQFTEAGVKLLNVGNINNGRLDLSTTKLFVSEEEAYGKYKHFLVEAGDLLIASSGILVENFHNKIAYAQEEHLPLCMNTSTIRFRPLNPNTLSLDYFKHFLMTQDFKDQLSRLITGSAQLNFGPTHLKQMTLPLPPLPEQKRIAAILDSADAIRQQRKAAIAKLDDLAQSVFLEMFGDPAKNEMGWPTATLGETAIHFTDGPFGSNLKSSHYTETGIPVIRLQNIATGKYIECAPAFISESHYANFPNNHCHSGDIVIATLGDPIIRACKVPDSIPEALNKADCILYRGKSNYVSNTYIECLLNSKGFYSIIKGSIHGQTRERVSSGQLKSTYVPVPPFSLQEEFSKRVNKTRSLIACHESALRLEQRLFVSLQHRAFTGEL